MALLRCDGCNEQFEMSFFKYWFCDCGYGSWAIQLLDYTQSEILDVFRFYRALKDGQVTGSKVFRRALFLSREFESLDNTSLEMGIDALLLFFDSLVIPDWHVEDLHKVLGQDKFDAYRSEGIVQCSDNSFVNAEFRGIGPDTKPYSLDEYDLELAAYGLENATPAPVDSVCGGRWVRDVVGRWRVRREGSGTLLNLMNYHGMLIHH